MFRRNPESRIMEILTVYPDISICLEHYGLRVAKTGSQGNGRGVLIQACGGNECLPVLRSYPIIDGKYNSIDKTVNVVPVPDNLWVFGPYMARSRSSSLFVGVSEGELLRIAKPGIEIACGLLNISPEKRAVAIELSNQRIRVEREISERSTLPLYREWLGILRQTQTPCKL